jgi:hypothetical protein
LAESLENQKTLGTFPGPPSRLMGGQNKPPQTDPQNSGTFEGKSKYAVSCLLYRTYKEKSPGLALEGSGFSNTILCILQRAH